MRRYRNLSRCAWCSFGNPKVFCLPSWCPSKWSEPQLGPVCYLPVLCECFIHCMASKKTTGTHFRHLNCFSNFYEVPWRTCSQNIWSKKIYLHLMWSRASKAASKLLGKCLCGRLSSPGPLIIQVRDLLTAQSGGFPACTPEFPFHKRNCFLFFRGICS